MCYFLGELIGIDYLTNQTGRAIPDIKLEKAKEKAEEDSDNEEEVADDEENRRDINEDDITFPDSLGTNKFPIILQR